VWAQIPIPNTILPSLSYRLDFLPCWRKWTCPLSPKGKDWTWQSTRNWVYLLNWLQNQFWLVLPVLVLQAELKGYRMVPEKPHQGSVNNAWYCIVPQISLHRQFSAKSWNLGFLTVVSESQICKHCRSLRVPNFENHSHNLLKFWQHLFLVWANIHWKLCFD